MPVIPCNGANLYYEVHGEGQPIVFLHGVWAGIRFFEPQLSGLKWVPNGWSRFPRSWSVREDGGGPYPLTVRSRCSRGSRTTRTRRRRISGMVDGGTRGVGVHRPVRARPGPSAGRRRHGASTILMGGWGTRNVRPRTPQRDQYRHPDGLPQLHRPNHGASSEEPTIC